MARVDHTTMTRRVRLAEVLLALIVVLGALVVGERIVSGSLFSDRYRLVVDLPEAAGLHKRSDVTYRGQHIGTVLRVELTEKGVRATLEIDEGVRIPEDTEVRVANLSAVGEQYVDFRPRTAKGPFYAADAVIEADRSALPVPTWQVLTHTQQLLRRIDTRDLATIAREINALFGSGEVDLPGVASEIGRTVAMLERLSPTLFDLLRNSETPLRTMNDLEPELRSFVANARSVAAQLKKSNPVIARLIHQGATVIPVLTEDFAALEPVLVKLLDDGTPVAAMARQHLPGLRHWYRWGPEQLVAMAEATRDGSGHVILVIANPHNCVYGKDVSPFQRDVALPLTARCTTVSPHTQQRGSQYVPSPD